MKVEFFMSETSEANSTSHPEDSWWEFIETLIPTIKAIASKYTSDHALAEDATQEALIALLKVDVEDIRGYQEYLDGEKDYEQWLSTLTSYCLSVAKNWVMITLQSYSTGNLYVGRTRIETEITETETIKVKRKLPARYVSMEMLIEEGAQITSEGDITWDKMQTLPDLMSEED